MNLDALKDFAQEHSISEVTLKLLFIQSINLAAADKYSEYDSVSFSFEKQKVFFVLSNVVTEKPLREMGRRFLLVNFKYYFDYLLSETYPHIFKFEGDVKTKIKEFYEQKNEVSYTSERYDDGPYCSACQQAPCMCSDREASSTIHDF